MPSIYPVTCHTDHIGPGSTFVAIKGYAHDGVGYIPEALQKGATKVVVEQGAVVPKNIQELLIKKNVHLLYVANTRKALAELSAQAAGYPAKQLKIIGITGTKGKTTTAYILAHILRIAGHKTALLSTVKNAINEVDFQACLTTAQPDYLHQFLKLCVQQNVVYVVMEVAAQALSLYRVDGLFFDGIIFTNFSQEHLEFYHSLDDYFAAKCLIFNHAKKNASILINTDDAKLNKIRNAIGSMLTFGFSAQNNFSIHTNVENTKNFNFIIKTADQQHAFLCPTLIGNFNIYNVLGAVGMASELGISFAISAYALQTFGVVPGRLEQYMLANGAIGVIDYAHNPSSYEVILTTLRTISSYIIVVFGAGGGRDKIKRPLMGAIAAQHADVVIVTTDNPRLEDPKDIVDDVLRGIPENVMYKVFCELDRKKAIDKAYKLSKKGSIIALLGKGPDEYQEIGGVKYPFSEKEILNSFM